VGVDGVVWESFKVLLKACNIVVLRFINLFSNNLHNSTFEWNFEIMGKHEEMVDVFRSVQLRNTNANNTHDQLKVVRELLQVTNML
jgi:hypothetical protein